MISTRFASCLVAQRTLVAERLVGSVQVGYGAQLARETCRVTVSLVSESLIFMYFRPLLGSLVSLGITPWKPGIWWLETMKELCLSSG